MTWPETHSSFYLAGHFTRETAAYFDAGRGDFGTNGSSAEGVLFYWIYPIAILENRSAEYVCIVDGESLAYGQCFPLRSDSVIQIGHFGLNIQPGELPSVTNSMLLRDLLSDAVSVDTLTNPVNERVLPHVMATRNVMWQAEDEEGDVDVLKVLSDEYKHFLIWGESMREKNHSKKNQLRNFTTDDPYFDQVSESMKTQTITTCILETPVLIDKVCEELEMFGNEDTEIFTDVKYNILVELAPENIMPVKKSSVSSLVLKEFYKAGLETLL